MRPKPPFTSDPLDPRFIIPQSKVYLTNVGSRGQFIGRDGMVCCGQVVDRRQRLTDWEAEGSVLGPEGVGRKKCSHPPLADQIESSLETSLSSAQLGPGRLGGGRTRRKKKRPLASDKGRDKPTRTLQVTRAPPSRARLLLFNFRKRRIEKRKRENITNINISYMELNIHKYSSAWNAE